MILLLYLCKKYAKGAFEIKQILLEKPNISIAVRV